MKNIILFTLLMFTVFTVNAQGGAGAAGLEYGEVEFDGETLVKMIGDNGDTILVAKLDDVSVTSPRTFANKDDYKTYLRYRRYAPIVYPYAKQAIRIFRETEMATTEMNKGKRKRYIKKLQKELKEEFEEPLKKLTKIQGYMLQKMIERETGTPLHTSIKELRGGFTAGYWSTFSRMFGYNLKEGYIEGEDTILDAVLDDFDVSHDF